MKRFKFLHTIFFASAFLFAFSCGGGRPRGVIPEEKMKAVIWDLAVAGEYANGYVYYQNPGQSRVIINNELLKEIYKVHGISKDELDKSLEYYKKNPKFLMAILDSVAAQHGARSTGSYTDPSLGNPPPSVIQSPSASPAPSPSSQPFSQPRTTGPDSAKPPIQAQ